MITYCGASGLGQILPFAFSNNNWRLLFDKLGIYLLSQMSTET